MVVTSKITVDLTRPYYDGRVSAVQGDGNTRQVEITLQAGGTAWEPPAGVEAYIAYRLPDGRKGQYNQLADGTMAISITGNTVTVILAPQMLAVAGFVQAQLVFNDAQLNRLTTFPFVVSVAVSPAAGAQKTEDYLRLQWLEDKLDEYLRLAKASGEFDGAPGKDGAPGRDGINGKDGDSTEATAAANAAAQSAENAEQQATDAASAAAEAKQAAETIGLMVDKKLDANPSQWPDWSIEEQAAARVRMGAAANAYRLILDVTLDADVKGINIDVDFEGKPIRLRTAKIIVIHPVAVNGDACTGYVRLYDSDNKTVPYYGAITLKSSDYEAIAVADVDTFGGQAPVSVTFTNAHKIALPNQTFCYRSAGNYVDWRSCIKGLRLCSNGTIEAGARIIILGKDA